MSSWRDQIIREFMPGVSRLTLAADPDGLLLEEGVLEEIRSRRFELVAFEDPVAFRYLYEAKFRSRWDRGEPIELVVVLKSRETEPDSLPYDLLQTGRRVSFNLGDIFPHLSYPVVAVLDRGDLDALFEAQTRYAPGHLGDNATKEFILRHVFEIAPELIKRPSDLLRALLRRHYHGQRIPSVLDERFIQLLRLDRNFQDWPLESIVPDRESFFRFLQERWPLFLDRLATEGDSAGERCKDQHDLPFDHQDIRVYIDNLFVEGLLQPVPHARADVLSRTWAGIGVRTEQAETRSRRLGKLFERIQASIPLEDARYGEWLHFARGWAELILLVCASEPAEGGENNRRIAELQAHVDAAFTAWLTRRYAGLINLPPVSPVMLHHLPRFMARQMDAGGGSRVALLLVDGLSLDQWLIVREELGSLQRGLLFRESALFAWIPTLTTVSRQAAFSGKPPMFFPGSIGTTEKEPALWSQFWIDQGLQKGEVVYAKGLGDGSLGQLEELLSPAGIRVAGLVIDKVDRIMHGMELGTSGMHNQVRQWARQPYLGALLDLLLDRGFHVFLTSDHGNLEAHGCGRPLEGAISDLRGERARIYPDPVLRAKVRERFPSALEWPPVGLPENYNALLAPDRQAFVPEEERVVSHGGASVEEVIVPLVQIERKDA